VNWGELGVTLAALAGGSIFTSCAYAIKRWVDWNWPKGHHSKRVHRYGVRDEDTTEVGDQDDGR
jgi:hypothetical protein